MGGIRLRGCGHSSPKVVMKNCDFEKTLDTNDEWIVSHTGIRERHIAVEESHLDLCVEAALKALSSASVKAEEIGVCIVATMTADTIVPSASAMVQKRLGLEKDTLCIDLNAACSGFVFALHTAECLLASSSRKKALVIGAECMSRLIDWDDRGTAILFGDGAGAAVVEYREEWKRMAFIAGADGNDEMLCVSGTNTKERSLIRMEGQRVFRFAVEAIPLCFSELLSKADKTKDDISYLVMHQANARIIDYAVKKMKVEEEKVMKNVDRYGNMSAASIPVLLSEMEEDGRLQGGALLALIAFGGGMTWGGALLEVER